MSGMMEELYQKLADAVDQNDKTRRKKLAYFVGIHWARLSKAGFSDRQVSEHFYQRYEDGQLIPYRAAGYMTVAKLLDVTTPVPEICFLSFCRYVIRWQNYLRDNGQPVAQPLNELQVNQLLKEFYGKKLSAKSVDDLVVLAWATGKVASDQTSQLSHLIQEKIEKEALTRRVGVVQINTTLLHNELLTAGVRDGDDLQQKLTPAILGDMRQGNQNFANRFRELFHIGEDGLKNPSPLYKNGLLSMVVTFRGAATGRIIPSREWLVRLGLRCRLTPDALNRLLEQGGYAPLGFYAWEIAAAWLLEQAASLNMNSWVFLRSMAHLFAHLQRWNRESGWNLELPQTEFATFNHLCNNSQANRERLIRILSYGVKKVERTGEGPSQKRETVFYWPLELGWPDLWRIFILERYNQTCANQYEALYRNWWEAVKSLPPEDSQSLLQKVAAHFQRHPQPAKPEDAAILAMLQQGGKTSQIIKRLSTLHYGTGLPEAGTLLFSLYCQALKDAMRQFSDSVQEAYFPAHLTGQPLTPKERGQLIFAACFYIVETGYFPFVYQGEPELPPYDAQLFLSVGPYPAGSYLAKAQKITLEVLRHYGLM